MRQAEQPSDRDPGSDRTGTWLARPSGGRPITKGSTMEIERQEGDRRRRGLGHGPGHGGAAAAKGRVGRHPRPADVGRRRGRRRRSAARSTRATSSTTTAPRRPSTPPSRRSAASTSRSTPPAAASRKRTLSKEGPHPLDDFRRIDRAEPDRARSTSTGSQAWHMTQERARGRRARRDHQHRLDRRVRGPDRPGRLHARPRPASPA